MVAPKPPNNLSKEYIAYSAGFYDGVEQQSAKTLELMNKIISDDISTCMHDIIKEISPAPVKQLINTQVIIDLLQSVQGRIESHCFICGKDKVSTVMINERSRPICLLCIKVLDAQFPDGFNSGPE